MALSSNSIIHFTSSKANLKSILENNFKIHYCSESIALNDDTFAFAAPMVSFCDIPLSEVKNHMSNYGNYGIGLTKEWAIKNGLNPVLYVQPNSELSKSYETAIGEFVLTGGNKLSSTNDSQKALLNISRYMKNYQADLTRSGKTIEQYRFSDEREWRYLPDFKLEFDMFINAKEYKKNKDSHNDKLSHIRLKFDANDIKYIIINSDDEITEFIRHLHDAKGKTYTYHDVERLTTRILTSEQIKGDI